MAGSDPFSSSSDIDTAIPSSLILDLHDVNSIESFPMRTLTIGPPWTLKIGRGSQTETDLHPHADNAWFGSRVMSREHALIKADPNTRRITLQDLGSMHGTYLEGRRLENGEAAELIQDDVVTFGANIIRGDLTYEALSLKLHFGWSTEYEQPSPISFFNLTRDSQNSPRPSADRFRNTFTADYNEEDRASDNDVEIIEHLSHNAKPQMSRKSRTFSVPDSDESEADSDVEVLGDSEPSSLLDDDGAWKPEDHPLHEQTENRIASVGDGVAAHQLTAGDALPQTFIEREEAEKDDDSAANMESESRESAKIINPAENLTDEDSDFAESEVESNSDDMSDAGTKPTEVQHVHDDSHHEDVQKENATSANTALPRVFSYSPSMSSRLPYVQSYGYYEQQPLQTIPQQPMQTQSPRTDPWRSSLSYCPYDYQYYSNPLPPMQTHPPAQVSWDSGFLPNTGSQTRPSFGLVETSPAYKYSKENWDTRAKDLDSSNAVTMPKVSISDILEQPRSDLPSLSTDSSRKRKADEISVEGAEIADVAVQGQTLVIIPDSPDEVQFPSAAENPTNDTEQSVETPEAVAKSELTTSSAVQTLEALDERPSKRLKVDDTAATAIQTSRGRTLLKYTATAVAGVAVGAVSTIFGLAALPTGFFE